MALTKVRFPPVFDLGETAIAVRRWGCDASVMKVQCCYCDQGIDPSDIAAIRITLSSLWRSEPVQDMYAHSTCAADKFARNLSSQLPFAVEIFGDD